MFCRTRRIVSRNAGSAAACAAANSAATDAQGVGVETNAVELLGVVKDRIAAAARTSSQMRSTTRRRRQCFAEDLLGQLAAAHRYDVALRQQLRSQTCQLFGCAGATEPDTL